jgi:hypothetical protein
MADYRDPKVTTTPGGSKMKWLWIALAAIVVLLLLWWLLTPDNEPVAVEGEPDAVIVAPADPGTDTATPPAEPAEPAN